MYDTIIIGCGPAGMTAAIYLARAGKKVLIFEKESIGGQIASSPLVENYPGYISITGNDLVNNMYEQVVNLNVSIEFEEVLGIKTDKIKEVITKDNRYQTKTIIIASGAKYRLLGLDNEQALIGNGIHFCVSCDGAFYKNKEVAVIGGGNTAIVSAIYLSEISKKVYVVQNLSTLTCEQSLKDKLTKQKNVEVIYNSKVVKINGEEYLSSIIIDDSDKKRELKIDGMFISIGLIPETEAFAKDINTNDCHYFISDDGKTNVDGIYVAGDCRNKKVRQLTTAVNDGTIAAILAIEYLNK